MKGFAHMAEALKGVGFSLSPPTEGLVLRTTVRSLNGSIKFIRDREVRVTYTDRDKQLDDAGYRLKARVATS